MAQAPSHNVRPRVISLDESAMHTEEFRLSNEFDQPLSATPEDFAYWNDGYTTWVSKVTAGIKSVDAHLADAQAKQAKQNSPESAQPPDFPTPPGWITLSPHQLINYEECGTIRLLLATDDTCEEPREFFEKYCSSDHAKLELKMSSDQMYAELYRAEEHRLAKLRGNPGAVDDSVSDDDIKLASIPTARSAGGAHNTFPIEQKRYHIIPLDIQLRSVVNNTPVPLGLQLESSRPNYSTMRKWFPETGQSNARDSLVGAYGYYVPAQTSAHHVGNKAEVLYRADHDHLTSEEFRYWGAYPTEELERQLIQYESGDGLFYLVPAPGANAQYFPDVIQFLVLRHYPALYRAAKTENATPYRLLTAQSWYNEANSFINVPKYALQNFISMIRRIQNLGLNMMSCDDVRLTCTPLNKSGWSVLPRAFSNFDTPSYTQLPAFHPAKRTSVAVELQIRYLPMHKPPKTVF